MDYSALAAELTNPTYNGLADTVVAGMLNTVNFLVDVETITPQQVFAVVDPSEYQALTATQHTLLWGILNMGLVYLKDPNTRTALAGMFGAGSLTRAALVALQTTTVSRATVIGLGIVKAGHVAKARALGVE